MSWLISHSPIPKVATPIPSTPFEAMWNQMLSKAEPESYMPNKEPITEKRTRDSMSCLPGSVHHPGISLDIARPSYRSQLKADTAQSLQDHDLHRVNTPLATDPGEMQQSGEPRSRL